MYGDGNRRNLSGIVESLERRKQQEIARWQEELVQCRKMIQTLKGTGCQGMTRLQLSHLQNKLHIEEKRRSVLIQKLKAAGVQVEKRGRPKKDPSEAYKQTHVKFTAMLKPENLEYLKRLKENGNIDNISAFLDELIGLHRGGLE